MTSIRRFTLSLLVASVFSLWFVSAGGVAGAERAGWHRTPQGYKAPVFGMSRTHDAAGQQGTDCARLTTTQIEHARLSRSVSRSTLQASPQVTVAGGAFEVVYTDVAGEGFRDSRTGTARKAALEASLVAWSKVLNTKVPIVVQARMEASDDPDSGLLASAGPVDYLELDNKAVPYALAAQLKGKSVNDGTADIEIVFNPDVDWDYVTNGRSATGKVSFVYVTLHELAHGLGFIDSFDSDTGELSNGIPFPYDAFVNRGTTTDNFLTGRSTSRVIRDLVSGDLFFNGPRANAASKRSIVPKPMVKLFAPDPYESGSSISHVDQDSYADLKVGLMTPYDFGPGSDKIDILTLGILEDIGYKLVPNATTAQLPKQ